VTPEAAAYLGKARDDLNDARTIVAIGLAKVAARSAYYAAFHAAQAYIVERTGKIAKTHSGLRTEFARLSKENAEIDRAFSTFLAKAYTYKEISDYGVGPGAVISTAEAVEAIEMAARMIARIAVLLGDRP
jgi:uncharacterized protein (UPF0332 family)